MNKGKPRLDDYETRRLHLASLTDEQLYERFWQLTNNAISPLLQLAKTNTSPAIERSILLRMGFSSIEAKVLVEKVIDYHLIGKGAGNVVYKYSLLSKKSIREAGLLLIQDIGFDDVLASFEVSK